MTADALQDVGRDAEADLLRSEHPIVLNDGRVEARKGSDAAHNAFANAYTQALLNNSFDVDGHNLRMRGYEPRHIQAKVRDEAHKRAARFLHDIADFAQDFKGDVTPDDLAEAYVASHNLHEEGSFASMPLTKAAQRKRLLARSERGGQLWLRGNGHNVAKGQSPWPERKFA